jgi:hypothetical protein
MAELVFTVAGSTNLVAATKKTAVRMNTHATARRANIGRILVADGSITSTDEPIIVRVYRNRGADSAGGQFTAVTPILQYGSSSGAVQGTVNNAYLTEPTPGSPDLLATFTCPTGSEIERFFEDPDGMWLEAAINSNISVELTSASARAAGILAYYEVTFHE